MTSEIKIIGIKVIINEKISGGVKQASINIKKKYNIFHKITQKWKLINLQ